MLILSFVVIGFVVCEIFAVPSSSGNVFLITLSIKYARARESVADTVLRNIFEFIHWNLLRARDARIKKRKWNLKRLGCAEILRFSRRSSTALAYILRVLHKGLKLLSRGLILDHLT